MSRDQDQDLHRDQDQHQDQGQDQSEASASALDLDAPAIQGAVFEYLAVLAESLERAAKAVATGNRGRREALEELTTVSVLVHYLRRRLAEGTGAPATKPPATNWTNSPEEAAPEQSQNQEEAPAAGTGIETGTAAEEVLLDPHPPLWAE